MPRFRARGIDCGCDCTGAYVPPALGSIAWNVLRSPRGTYTVEPFSGFHGLVVRLEGDAVLTFGPTTSTVGWGFGAEERGLLIHSTIGGGPSTPAQHTAWLYDLENPAVPPWQAQNLVSEAISVFSPRGRYLLHAILNAQHRAHLWAGRPTLLPGLDSAPRGDGADHARSHARRRQSAARRDPAVRRVQHLGPWCRGGRGRRTAPRTGLP